MHAAADRPEFAPPPPPGLLRAFVLAVLAHLLLVAALMHGLQWQRDAEVAVAEAELWSALPQEAAPREQVAPPAPPPPVVKAPPKPEPPQRSEADIALEREKKRQELEKQKQAELEREREEQRRLEAAKKKREEEAQRRREEQERLAEAKKKEEERKRRQEQVAKQLREENLQRMAGLAGATGAPDATGTAQRSAGPSATYAGRIAALIKRNTRFVDTVPGDPPVEVEIRLAPDGTIVGTRIRKSSGNAARDDAVLRGIQATERLPRDELGRIHTPLLVSVRQFR